MNHRQTAALRLYQITPASDCILDIADDGGTIDPLDDDEIDQLCETLNCEESK